MTWMPVFAYVGPETILPAASALAAIAGVVLTMGRSVLNVLTIPLRPFRKHRDSENSPAERETESA